MLCVKKIIKEREAETLFSHMLCEVGVNITMIASKTSCQLKYWKGVGAEFEAYGSL